ncbi:MAG: hypothetical protein ABSB41_12325 [Anaerolineales bacterium]
MQPKYTIQLNTRVVATVRIAGAAFALGALVSFLRHAAEALPIQGGRRSP